MTETAPEVFSSRALIEALTNPAALQGIRRCFGAAAFEDGLRGLVVELIDPQLLKVVLGPELAPKWAPGLEKLYSTMRERHPSHFPDIDQSWRRQRNYWHSLLRSAKGAAKLLDEEAEAASAAAGGHGDVVDRTQGAVRLPGAAQEGSNGRVQPRPAVKHAASRFPGKDLQPTVSADGGDEEEPPDAGGSKPGGGKPGRESSAGRGCAGVGGGPGAVASGSGPPPGVVRGADVRMSDRLSGGPAGRALSADSGAAVAELLSAMLHSDAALEKVRRRWASDRGGSSAWDRWAVPRNLGAIGRNRPRR